MKINPITEPSCKEKGGKRNRKGRRQVGVSEDLPRKDRQCIRHSSNE
jgi:hypothetical protein